MTNRTAAALLAALLAVTAGAMTSRQAIDAIKAAQPQEGAQAATNAPQVQTTPVETPSPPVVAPQQPPSEAQAAPSAAIWSGDFRRPSLAIASDGRAFLSAEGPDMRSTYTWTRAPGAKTWTGGLAIEGTKGGPADAGRVYVPSTLENGLTAERLGPKEWGSMQGPGIVYQAPDGKTTFRFTGYTTGAPRLARHAGRSFLMTKNGAWAELAEPGSGKPAGAFLGTGSFPAGNTGEKFAFSIGPDGRWHSAMNGYSKEAGTYTVSAGAGPAGGRKATWVDYPTYPDQGNDLCYPGLLATSNAVYIASVFGGHLRMQQATATGSLLYKADALLDLGPAALEDRFPPRLVDTPAGAVVLWRRGNDVTWGRIKALTKTAKGKGDYQPRRLAAGSFATAAWDEPAQALVVVFVAGGNLREQRIPIATLKD